MAIGVNSIDIANQSQYSSNQSKEADNGLGKDAFLKLLVTQLRYQNPMKPMQDKEFISQMAQFSSLEQMSNLNETMTYAMSTLNMNILGLVEYQQLSEASNLVGKEVKLEVPVEESSEEGTEGTENSDNQEDGNEETKTETITGVIDKVKLTEQGPMVVIGDEEYSINYIKEILG